eukprot:1727502-Prymnesium_polylepis.1
MPMRSARAPGRARGRPARQQGRARTLRVRREGATRRGVRTPNAVRSGAASPGNGAPRGRHG